MTPKTDDLAVAADDNQVILRGRLAAYAVLRELPSGTELCTFRINVRRPDRDRTRVDSLECATSRAGVRRTVLRAVPDDVLEVRGSLHRRFWRGGAGLGSRYEIDVVSARITSRRRTDASPGRKRASV